MATRNTTRNALRATLKQEDAALSDRLPTAPAAKPAARARKAPAGTATKTPAPKRPTSATAQAAATTKRPAPAKPAATKAPTPARRVTARKPATATTAKPAAGTTAVRKPTPRTVTAPATPPASAVNAAVEKIKGSAKEGRKVKIERDSFSMPENEHKSIRKLRDALEKAGRGATKSEILRAGVALLASRSPAEIIVLLDALPAVRKGKRAKKR